MVMDNNEGLIKVRKKLIHDFCDTCLQPTALAGCGTTFRSILEPIHCPQELLQTHTVCQFCLDLRPRLQNHREQCAFSQRGLQLHAGGWATPLSNLLLQSIRHSTFLYFNPLANLLRILILELGVEDAAIVPVPIGSIEKTELWIEMLCIASVGIGKIEVIPILKREKRQSTRKSVSQVRERIVRQEYEVDTGVMDRVKDRTIILIDDNVTTGKTLTHCASLLFQLKTREIIPLAIERQVSMRVLQRSSSHPVDACPFYVSRDEDAQTL